MRQSANLVAAGLGIECTDLVLAGKRIALAPEDAVLPGSGLLVAKGTVAGAQWEFVASSGDHQFLRITNEQTAVLGLGPGWRANHDEPPWRVEIDGEPPIVATFGWPDGVEPGAANSLLNAARAMNIVPRLVAAPPGCVSVLDFPAVTAGDGLAPA
jgi:4-hydroxy-tetrahydrodipicolinate reductase